MTDDRAAIETTAETIEQLRIITNALEVSLTEPMTKNWIEFCKALIERSRSIMEELERVVVEQQEHIRKLELFVAGHPQRWREEKNDK
jgi:hypothetical protein